MPVVGVRQEKWVVVAPYNGEYEFPSVSVDWWNAATGKQATARIEPTKMVVTGGAAPPVGTPPVPAKSAAPELPAQADKAAGSAAADADTSWFSWSRFAAVLLLIWAVLSLAWLAWLWWQKHRRSPPRQTLAAPRKLDAKAVWKRLEQACQQNQPQATHDALVQWLDVGLNIRPLNC
ncbi:MAG: hypothetical protein BWK73_50350 [Thiothrix lacustris]|uniref:DUF7939 domain-containing protein n=1 Tax=Thiothrix lacustris TaxID=525917 RepID=A0A1Y1Q8N9_9GAMM|nr:MAG: hypothetical protein BWK73_50350 [Thiothrix lacustris]